MSKIRHPEKINKPINPIKKKPEWIRSKIIDSQVFFKTKEIVNKNNLNTVCQEANCPNITECWSKKHATFMIMGDTCTRGCAFCDVKTGKPGKLDSLEPLRISNAIKELNLNHVVITSVDRDDLSDGGANHFKKVILESKNSLVVIHGRYSLYLTEEYFNNFEGGIEGGERMGFYSSRDSDFEDKETRVKNMKETIKKGIRDLLSNNITVVLVYPVPEVGWNVPREIWKRGPKNNKLLSNWLVLNPISTSLDLYKERNKEIIEIFDSFTETNIIRVKPSKILCNTETHRCFTHNEKIIYYSDDDHLSSEGANILNNEIIKKIKIYNNPL